MDIQEDYYGILGITEDEKRLPQDEFNKALKAKFRKLSIEEHPDRWAKSDENERKAHEDKFKEINEAYSVLSDPNKKQEYDMRNSGFGFFGSDMFDDFGFGPFGHAQQPVKRGSDLKIVVRITLEDVLNGSIKKVSIKKKKACLHCHKEKCPNCGGTGVISKNIGHPMMQVLTQTTCPHCGGTGYVSDLSCMHCNGKGYTEESVEESIAIPKGIENNMQFTIQGRGNEYLGIGGGHDGDLVVLVKVEEHERFERFGSTLVAKLPLSISDALNGCQTDFTCLDGKRIKITIPPLTAAGKQFNLNGKGLPELRNNMYIGPLVLSVDYVMPKSPLTDRQKELLREFDEIERSKN